MEVKIDPLPERYEAEMVRLLAGNMEMLHRFPADGHRCLFCKKYKSQTEWDDECHALLRHALNLAVEAAAHFAHCRQCGEVSVSTCDEGGREYAIKLGLYKPE